MYEKELVIIALYPGMKEDILDISASMNINPTIIEWDVTDYALIEQLKKHFEQVGWPDVIISRGAIANLIEQTLPEVASVRAEAEELAMLTAIQDATKYGPRIGVLMFEEFAADFDLEAAKQLLQLPELQIYPFRTGEDIRNQVTQGQKDHLDAMIGTRMAYRTGQRIGLTVIPLNSGRLSLQKAMRQSVSVIQARQKEKVQLRSFNEAVSSIMEGVLSIQNGMVIAANQVACDIFRVFSAEMVGKVMLDLPIVKASEAIRSFLTDGKNGDVVLKIQRQDYYVKKTCLGTEKNRRIILVLRGAKEIQEQENRVRTELRSDGFSARYHFSDMIGDSFPIQQLKSRATLYAETDANILIFGESGTGKELLAQSIHNASRRSNEPFVAVNCAAIPATLLESELFGYEEGAFSGAKRGGKRGLFELAHKGTIFLDEINSMPMELQSTLLRTLQEKEIRRIGSQKNIYVDIRVIAACNDNLNTLIQKNLFRSDLYYRLNTLRLTVPSLNERTGDIRQLAEYYLMRYSQSYHMETPVISDSDFEQLEHRSWPGNIRELSNVIHRYVILNQNLATSIAECLDDSIIPAEPVTTSSSSGKQSLPESPASPVTLADMERSYILERLNHNHGNRSQTAEELGIARSTLWKKLEEYQIS